MSLPMKPALWCPGIRQGHPLARGLVAGWPWAGSPNLRDVVGRYHMTAYNSPTAVPDEFGRVVDFTAGSTQYLKNASPVVAGEPLSVSMWIKANDVTANYRVFSIVNEDDVPGEWFLIQLRGATAGDYVRAWSGHGETYKYAVTTAGYSAGVWTHVVAVWAADDDRRVYIDGGNKGTNADSLAVAGLDVTYIGAGADGVTVAQPFDGAIAFPCIWNSVLTDLEVGWLYEDPWSLITPRRRTYFWVAASGGAGGEALEKALFDSVGVADSRVSAIGLALSDSVGAADALAKQTGMPLADSVGVAEAIVKSVGQALADSVGVADSRVSALGKALADSVGVSDSIAHAFAKALTDSVGVADAITGKAIGKVLEDAVGVGDVFSTDWEYLLRILALALAMSEAHSLAMRFDQAHALTWGAAQAHVLALSFQGGG